MPMNLAIDLTAPVDVYLTLRGGVGGTLTVQVLSGGRAIDLTGASVRYVANTSPQIIKTVGSGITLVAPTTNGTFLIVFDDAETAARNTTQGKDHECKLQQLGGEPVAVFEGKLQIERSLFTTV